MNRRSGRVVATWIGAVVFATAACGSPSDSGRASDASSDFPVSISHQFGSTTIESRPTRVLTLGLSDQDSVLAVGVKPIAVSYWFGDEPFATGPWAQDELGDSEPVVLADGQRTEAEPPLEEIASLKPDVIVSLYNGTTKTQYDLLSKIAPTIVPSTKYANFTISWQESVRVVGEALGRQEQAEAATERLQARLDQTAAAHPEFDGASAVLAERFEPGQSVVRGNGDPRMRFLRELGFTLEQSLAEDANEYDEITVSDEVMDRLDQDVLIWNVPDNPQVRTEIETSPVHDTLEVVRDGREIFIEDSRTSAALTWGTALSLDYAIDRLERPLAAALR